MFPSSQISSSRCLPPCAVSCPQPLASAWNQPCVTSCGDSRAVIHPPPVVITFPGPILASCPQESLVGSCGPAAFMGSASSYGNSYSFGRSYSSCGSRFGSCRPC